MTTSRSVGLQRRRDVLEDGSEVVRVVQRRARDDDVGCPGRVELLERQLVIAEAVRGPGVDATSVVARALQRRDETAMRAASEVDHACRRFGQM